MFKNLLTSVKSLLHNEGKETAIKKITELLNNSLADNTITPDELAELHKVQTELGLTDADMADVKLKIVDTLMDKINADGKVSEDEVKMFNDLKTNLGVDAKVELSSGQLISKDDILKGLDQVKGFLVKVKNKTVEVGTKVVNEAKELTNKTEVKTENTTPPVDTTTPPTA